MFTNIKNENDELARLIETQTEPEITVDKEDFLTGNHGLKREVFNENIQQECVIKADIEYTTVK